MSDQTLELDLYDLEAEVGDSAGYGVGARFGDTAWTDEQQRRITKSVHAGCRMVYYTQSMTDPNAKPIDDIPAGYTWSFLQPRGTFKTGADNSAPALPRDFNGILGDVIPASTDGSAQFTLRVVPYQHVYYHRSQSPNQTGRPCMAAVQAMKGPPGRGGSRWTLELFPTPDAAYTLQVWYEISPKPLTPEFPYPYGGAPLAETFKAAVRAAFEQDYDRRRDHETIRFLERLRAAIAADRKLKPLTVGYNGDNSDSMSYGRPNMHGSVWGVPLFVNGTQY